MRIREMIEREEAAAFAQVHAEMQASNPFYGVVRLLNNTRAGKLQYTEEYNNLLKKLRHEYKCVELALHWSGYYKACMSPHGPDSTGCFDNDCRAILDGDYDWDDPEESDTDDNYITITDYEEEADVLTTPINLVLA